jgi:MFS transporter, DHA1 family, tetracycline resistance protein
MLAVILVVFTDLLGFGIVIPLLPFYAQRFSPEHPFVITMLMATYSGLQLFAAPIWGRLSDRIGRRKVLLVSVTTSVLAYLWLSQASALWMLFAARGLQGISAGNISVAQAYIADITTPQNRAKGMGAIGAAFGLGFTLGPAIGGWLAGDDLADLNVALPSLAAASMSAVALILGLFMLREPLSPELRAMAAGNRKSRVELIREAFSRPRLRHIMILFFTTTFAFAGMESTFAQYALARLSWGPRSVGWVFGGVGVLLILVQGGLIGKLVKTYGEPRLLFGGALMIGVGLAGLAVATAPLLAIISTAVLAFGQGIAAPATSALVSREAAASEQGGILGVNQSMGSLARLLGPAAAGLAFEFGGPGAPYVLGTIVMLGAAALAASLVRRLALRPIETAVAS